ncbi:hypothetical protein V8E53_000858 [Lactarius tabidus]
MELRALLYFLVHLRLRVPLGSTSHNPHKTIILPRKLSHEGLGFFGFTTKSFTFSPWPSQCVWQRSTWRSRLECQE